MTHYSYSHESNYRPIDIPIKHDEVIQDFTVQI